MNDQGIGPRNGSYTLILLVLCLFPVIGFFLGLGVNYGMFVHGENPRWRRIPDPPSPAIELVSAAPGCVYIKSADDNNYLYCENAGTKNNTWEHYKEVENNIPGIPCPEDFPDIPDDAHQVVEFCEASEYIDNTQFALFHDGSIRIRRSQGSGWGSFYRGVILSLGGGLLGLIAGIGYYLYRGRKQT